MRTHMKDEELISAIRKNSDLDDVERIKEAARATLSVLGQRVSGEEPRHLGAQLPPSFGEMLPDEGGAEQFDLNEFYRRVAEMEGHGCSNQDARRHAKAVIAAVKSAVTPGEFDDLLSQLPSEYGELVGAGPVH
jgi:uncharacterized protein (DUF2267 family)